MANLLQYKCSSPREVFLLTSCRYLTQVISSVYDVLIIDHVLLLLLVDVVLLHLFELIGVSCADEVALHVVDVAIRVHQILLVLSLNLNSAHHHVIFDIYALFLFLVSRALLLVVAAIWEETLVGLGLLL